MPALKFGELFAGVGGFGMGLERAGMECAWQVEIDPWANQVLCRHWPHVIRTADITFTEGWHLSPVDVIAFGSPCQDLSVAGQRKGMGGERSGLFFEAIKIIREIRPAFVIWENVPGALSSNHGRDFAGVLHALADIGALDICWRVLDAQFFGVPQRRRRLFLVADFRGERAEQILFEPQGGAGDSAASGAEGTDVAYALAASARGTGDGHGNAWNTTYVETGQGWWTETQPSLRAQEGGVPSNPVASGQTARYGKGTDSDACDALLVAPFDERNVTSPGNRSRVDFGSPAPTLHEQPLSVIVADTVRSHPRPGSNSLGNVVARTLLKGGHGNNPLDETLVAAPLTAGGHPNSNAPGRHHEDDENLIVPRVAAALNPGHEAKHSYAGDGGTLNVVGNQAGVRRLTPRECERLMGWEDDHTRWTADGREIPDTHRYRLIGNGVVSNVAAWIGKRIVAS